MKITLDEHSRAFAQKISDMIGQNIDGCYQCGKCTAGCPIAYTMEFSPHEVIRLVQLGGEEEALTSHTIWLCASCETCTSRCPKNIDVAAVMDALRILAFGQGRTEAEKEITLFHKLFLKVIERFGRVNDLHLMGRYNLLTLNPLKDWRLGRKLLAKGKLKLTTPPVKGLREFQEIFRRVRANQSEEQ
ncbi:MAG: 4Fe-4S dicluster domain-containing protein [Deltaproteobacteria bacterium]|nr:4Fe-4S dicluster domain-containing protein [Deltaproteobacteria bacterium]